jgi:hypothetical protein
LLITANRERSPLEEASTLGPYGISLCNVDLSKLIRGDSLTLPCIVNSNQLGIKTSALINTRANSFIFINTKFAKLVCHHLDLTLKQLPVSCGV